MVIFPLFSSGIIIWLFFFFVLSIILTSFFKSLLSAFIIFLPMLLTSKLKSGLVFCDNQFNFPKMDLYSVFSLSHNSLFLLFKSISLLIRNFSSIYLSWLILTSFSPVSISIPRNLKFFSSSLPTSSLFLISLIILRNSLSPPYIKSSTWTAINPIIFPFFFHTKIVLFTLLFVPPVFFNISSILSYQLLAASFSP